LREFLLIRDDNFALSGSEVIVLLNSQ